MWAGTLVFGLVEIPVRLGPATRPRELAFRQVHAEDGGRITFRRSCTACSADVPYAGVAKAYQRPDGALVPLTDDDLAALPLEAAHRIEVHCFVAAGTIDPLLVARSYVLTVDTSPGADRAYRLFHTALAQSGRVAVATITLRQREARAAVWARGPALVLQTLLTPDELTDPESAPDAPARADSDPDLSLAADLPLAADLIAAMTAEFDPAAHHDRYRDQLEDLVHRKASGHPGQPGNPSNSGHSDSPSPSHPGNPDSSIPSPSSPNTPGHPKTNAGHTSNPHPADPTGRSAQTNVTDLTELLRASLATAR
jgi:DNA end-binding protein Ku